jgi:mannitol/fructose-specific phosphotransferase system IIA component (Ntr-type)
MSTVTVPSVDPSLFIPDLKPKRRESILQDLVGVAHRAGAVRDAELLRDTLLRRERWSCSAIGKGVAVPHARSIAVTESRLVIARLRRGVEWNAPDGQPVQLVLAVFSPSELGIDAHVDRVARAVAITRLQRNRQRLLEAGDAEGVASLLREFAS